MMSIAFYHLLHMFALVGLIASLTHLCFQEQYSKKAAMVYGLSTLVMLVAGVGMTHKYSLDMASPWLLGKIIIWLIAGMSIPMIAKRMPHLKMKAYTVVMVGLAIAIALVNYKPV